MPVVPPSTVPPDNQPAAQDRGLPPAEGENPPPVSESTQWRSRALKAEDDAMRLEAELSQTRASLDAARQQLDQTEQRSAMQRELQAAGAIDLDATVLLVEQALRSGQAADVPAAVEQLRARKAVLFAAPAGAGQPRHSSMSSEVDPQDRTTALAARARETGDRRLLLSYLRARRAR